VKFKSDKQRKAVMAQYSSSDSTSKNFDDNVNDNSGFRIPKTMRENKRFGLLNQADEIDKIIWQEIKLFKPKGRVSDIADVLRIEPPENQEFVETPFGKIGFLKKRCPNIEDVKRWDVGHRRAESLRKKALDYLLWLPERKEGMTSGSFNVVINAEKMLDEGLLTEDEKQVLVELKKAWDAHPEADRIKDIFIWRNGKFELYERKYK